MAPAPSPTMNGLALIKRGQFNIGEPFGLEVIDLCTALRPSASTRSSPVRACVIRRVSTLARPRCKSDLARVVLVCLREVVLFLRKVAFGCDFAQARRHGDE